MPVEPWKKICPKRSATPLIRGGRLKAVLRQASDEFVQPINKAIADFIKLGLDKKNEGGKELSGRQLIGGTAAIIGSSYVMSKVGKSALGNIAQRLLSKGGSTAIGVAEGKAIEAAAGVTPVFVVNWPGSGIAGQGVPLPSGVGGAAAGGGKKAVGWFARHWKTVAGSSMGAAASELLPLFIAGGAGYGIGTGLNYGLGGISGWASGGKYKGAGWMGEQIYDAVHPEKFDMKYESAMANAESRRQQNYINLHVQIDSQGRVFSRSDSMNTSVKETNKRGDFFEALTNTDAM